MSDAVESLARTLWEKAGKPEGRDLEFWLAAESLVGADESYAQQPKAAPSDVLDGLPPPAIVGGD